MDVIDNKDVLEAIAHVKLQNLPNDQILELMTPEGGIRVNAVPEFGIVDKMTHRELIATLKNCPCSARFGELRSSLNTGTLSMRVARQQVYKLVYKSAD